MDHWRYFLALDDDFGTLSRYVEPTAANLHTYSLEIARVLMAATQECDVVLKQVCAQQGSPTASNERDYRIILCPSISTITKLKILIPKFGLDSIPFEAWQSNQTPDWWAANNKVKHERHLQFPNANMRNVISAIAGLYTANLYLYRNEAKSGKLEPAPVHFAPDLPSVGAKHLAVICYNVPN